MKNIQLMFVKNWKTTLAGVAVLVVGFLKLKQVIDTDTATFILSVLGAVGLVASKDADKTGVS